MRRPALRLLLIVSLVFSFSALSLAPVTVHAETKDTNTAHSTKAKKPKKTETKTITKVEVIKFKTVRQDDPSLAKGQTRVLQNGVNGSRTKTYSVTVKNGKQGKRKLISNVITLAPVNKIVGVGSYVAPPPAPAPTPQPSAPTSSSSASGATAQCVDGSYSYAANHQGACSHHGGVATWYN